jgi:hypothetical protein
MSIRPSATGQVDLPSACNIIRTILQTEGPLPKGKVCRLARERGVRRDQAYLAKRFLEITTRRWAGGPRQWCLPGQSPKPAHAYEEAKEFLRTALQAGRKPRKEIVELARQHGVKAIELGIAKAQLGVVTEYDRQHRCFWSWPEDAEGRHNTAIAFLGAALAEGPMQSLAVVALARSRGITRKILIRAKEELGVQSHHRCGRPWYWCLPGQEIPEPQEHAHTPAVASRALSAQQFLRNLLAKGRVAAREGAIRARLAGIAKKDLYAALRVLGVPLSCGGWQRAYFWQLPPTDAPAAATGQPRATTATHQPSARRNRRPAEETHRQWKEWHDSGMGYGRIAMHHNQVTGDDVTKDAVAKAIKRLEQDASGG